MKLNECDHIFKVRGIKPFRHPHNAFPPCTAIYFITEILDNEEKVIYVGSTDNLRARMSSHHIVKKLIKQGIKYDILISPCKYAWMRITERRLIYAIQPKLNGHSKKYEPPEDVVVPKGNIINPVKFEILRVFANAHLEKDFQRRSLRGN